MKSHMMNGPNEGLMGFYALAINLIQNQFIADFNHIFPFYPNFTARIVEKYPRLLIKHPLTEGKTRYFRRSEFLLISDVIL